MCARMCWVSGCGNGHHTHCCDDVMQHMRPLLTQVSAALHESIILCLQAFMFNVLCLQAT